MMRRHAVTGGGGLLSMGIVWIQVMCAKGDHGHSQPAFTSMATAPSRSPAAMTASSTMNSAALGGGRLEALDRRPRSQLIFIGCGSSTGVPSPFRLLHPELDTRQSAIDRLAVATPPEVNKNYRGNTSVLLRVVRDKRGATEGEGNGETTATPEGQASESRGGTRQQGGENEPKGKAGAGSRSDGLDVKHIQIDTGKTWREGVIRWFPRHEVKGIDAIVLTHDHADAMLGLDDVRGLQNPAERKIPTPVFVSEHTKKSIKRVFPYLVGREEDNGAGGRFVSSLKFVVINDFEPFEVAGLEVTAFPVLHGEDYVSHGFLFGPEGNKICYISDVSRVPPESMEFIRKHGPVQLLVCDALIKDRKHPTHFCRVPPESMEFIRKHGPLQLLVCDALMRDVKFQTHFCVEDSVELARELNARRTLLVGMSGDIEYYAMNAALAKREEEDGDPHVRVAHDGLAVDVDMV